MIKYEIDPHNRLIVEETGRRLPISRYRRTLAGRFKIGKDNTLVYHVKSPIDGTVPDISFPHQVRLKGRWSLNNNHDLVLTLNKWRRQRPGDELTLQGELLGAEANALLFSVTTRTKEDTETTHILKLEGTWQADKHNRLTFRLRKGRQYTSDILILDNIWQIGKNHRIIYTYDKRVAKGKKRVKKTLTFTGRWDIKKRYRLSYMLGLKGKSAFNFKTSLGILDNRSIAHELGIGLSAKDKPRKRTVKLFGTWKIVKNVGLLFQIEREEKGTQNITFGARAKLNKNNNISFKLKSETGKDLGMDLILERNILKGDGEAFIRLLRVKGELAIYAGMAWRW